MKGDTRALLAVIAVVSAFAYQGAMLAVHWDSAGQLGELQIPSWMSAVVMGIIGFYFGSKSESNGGNHR